MIWDGKPLGDIRVRTLETEDAVELSVAHTLPAGADVLLHWGVTPEGVSGWTAPDPSLWPSVPSGAAAATNKAGAQAVQSAFPGEGELRLKFPKAVAGAATAGAVPGAPPPPPLPAEVRFVVMRRDPAKGEMWLNKG